MLRIACLLTVALTAAAPAFAQGLNLKREVAPEYRAYAEKRAEERRRIFVCNKRAEEAKVLRRDLTEFLGKCIDNWQEPPPANVTVERKL